LSAINVSNAAKLTPRCILQLGEIGSFETSPLVYRGRMYVTTAHKTFAADAKTCTLLWSHSYTSVGPEHIVSNRGVALYRGRVYRGTPDGHLLSLDADTGRVVWDIEVADPNAGYFVSAAPMIFDGKLYVGEGGGDHGIRGHIHAFDAATGKALWIFDVIPTGDEPGADTWSGGQATGGGSSWSSMAVDPQHRLLFVPTGNPGPDFNPNSRKGANLYTDSVVVLDADTGKLAWYVQQVPADFHDWDTAAAPSIYDQDGRQFMAVASKDGYLYLYDRNTHRTIATATTMTRVNADVPFNGTTPVRYCPGGLGQWNGPAYSPQDRLLFVGAADRCDTIQMEDPKYVKGQLFFGGMLRPGKNESMSGTVRGIDAATGQERWIYHSPTVIVAGVTPTAGGLLMTGEGGGDFLVFDAKSGKTLYRFATGGGIAAGITTYEVDGEQLIAVPSGNSSRFVWNTSGSATVIVFGLAQRAAEKLP
jgi:PQQ-dependent dehydrogenase (methanol/ethanol family)